jgi:lipid-binding SYLF domain-containing protein
MKYRSVMSKTGFAVVALMFSALALGVTKAEIDAGVDAALSQFYAHNAANRELADKAAAMLVFPHVTKGGVGVGGAYGEGALLINGKTSAYYKVGAASIGATLGVAQRSEIILFMTEEARDKFLNSKGWTIGADAGVALVHVGAGGQYDTETLRRPIIAFVFGEKGLIADISLEGSKITKIIKA